MSIEIFESYLDWTQTFYDNTIIEIQTVVYEQSFTQVPIFDYYSVTSYVLDITHIIFSDNIQEKFIHQPNENLDNIFSIFGLVFIGVLILVFVIVIIRLRNRQIKRINEYSQ
jgi:hypothetical protein